MSNLTKGDIAKLAYLARLKLSDDELDHYAAELSKILDYIEQLSAVDTDNLKPTLQVTGLSNVMRKDEVVHTSSKDDLLKNAYELLDDQIKVRRMIG
ncbi:MAG: Asp-tRNA(Asn)/Glu-tRNA(Gln) amidotransferase subunit GatC [bacterium]|nr:Asp-tRNA(Asn)/Glu-tRNA(Gln) amidotransferase subunit GatC [bacterium]